MKKIFVGFAMFVLALLPFSGVFAYTTCNSEVTNGFANANDCANLILTSHTTQSSTSFAITVTTLYQTTLDRSIDVLFDYWPTILTVAVTIGVAFFLIRKALSAVRGHI